ncbi:MAG: hypothetical protein HY397_03720 [Candidatus Doudnabacteria bacterium]|nr:hypothetical protein [Candidatus Doudnabacteria bacterium]
MAGELARIFFTLRFPPKPPEADWLNRRSYKGHSQNLLESTLFLSLFNGQFTYLVVKEPVPASQIRHGWQFLPCLAYRRKKTRPDFRNVPYPPSLTLFEEISLKKVLDLLSLLIFKPSLS